MAEEELERFHATGGRLMGGLALAVSAAGIVLALYDGWHRADFAFVSGALLLGLVCWAALLRPQLKATESDLVMRNMLSTDTVPLAAIEQVVVQQVTAVAAGGRRFVSPVIGRSLRQTMRRNRPPAPGTGMPGDVAPPRPEESYPDYVEDRIGRLADDARAALGLRRGSEELAALAAGARREWAWPVIAALVATLVLFVATIFQL